MAAWKTTRFAAGVVGICLLAAFVAGCLANAKAITEVRIRLKAGVDEPGDQHLLGIGDADKLPDYLVRIRTKDGWEAIGTRLNTSAVQWLSFPIAEPIPLRRALELQLVEDDKVENDILEQLPIRETSFAGDRFEFATTTKQRIETGIEWFFDTPVGKAISLGITIAVVIFILALVRPVFS